MSALSGAGRSGSPSACPKMVIQDQGTANVFRESGVAALPLVAFFTDYSDVLTGISTLLAISWFLRLWYLSIKKEWNKKNG